MSRDRGRCQQCSSIRTQGKKRVLRASTKSLNKLAAVSALHETLEELAGDGGMRHHLPRPPRECQTTAPNTTLLCLAHLP